MKRCNVYATVQRYYRLFMDFFKCCQMLKTLSAHLYFDDIQEQKLVFIRQIDKALDDSLYKPNVEITTISRELNLYEGKQYLSAALHILLTFFFCFSLYVGMQRNNVAIGFEPSESEHMYKNRNGLNTNSYYVLSSGAKTICLQSDNSQKIRKYLQVSNVVSLYHSSI